MKKNPIPTCYKGVTSVLLLSQLILSSSCLHEPSISSTLDNNPTFRLPLEQDSTSANIDETTLEQHKDNTVATDASLATVVERTRTFTTHQDHQIEFIKDSGKWFAQVQENLPDGSIKSYQLEYIYLQGVLLRNLR